MPKPVCQHQDRRSKASRVVRGLQDSGCPMTRHLCHLMKTDRRAPEVAKCPTEAAGNSPGTDQWPGWTPESEWQLQQACKLSVMISVFATWVSFYTFWVRHQRSPRPCRESLQMPSSTALSNEHVQAILWNVLSWNVRCLIFFGPQSLQKWLLANASAEAAAASMQTQCDDQGVCQVRWSVWWSVCLPREFPFLLFELGIKEVPDLAVSPCKCRVPLLLAMNMSKQFFETSCHGMSDAWSLNCTYLWATEKSRLNLAAVMEGKAPGRELRHAVTTFDVLGDSLRSMRSQAGYAAWCMFVAVGRCEAKAIESGSLNLWMIAAHWAVVIVVTLTGRLPPWPCTKHSCHTAGS